MCDGGQPAGYDRIGSTYEVIHIEPSATMAAQRPGDHPQAIDVAAKSSRRAATRASRLGRARGRHVP